MTLMRVEVLLTAVIGLGALSIDMFLPSLPTIAAVFATDPPTAQLTVTLFLIAFAVSQLVCGPLSDRFGRRGVLLVGLALLVVGSESSGSNVALILLSGFWGYAVAAQLNAQSKEAKRTER